MNHLKVTSLCIKDGIPGRWYVWIDQINFPMLFPDNNFNSNLVSFSKQRLRPGDIFFLVESKTIEPFGDLRSFHVGYQDTFAWFFVPKTTMVNELAGQPNLEDTP